MLRLALALPAVLLAGCAWISDQAAAERLDPDGDGVSWDQDCDDTDPDVSATRRWFADADGDGYGDPDQSSDACAQPDGFVADDTDCDDARPDVHPGAVDTCDDVDQDCDGLQPDPPEWYVDGDGDGVGGTETVSACEVPEGASAVGGDCDDEDAAVYPGAMEQCSTAWDDNCDGATDDGADAPVWYADADEDGYGDDAATSLSCTQPDGAVPVAGDCDDSDPEVHPLATESCDSAVDMNCDGHSGADDSDHDGWIACQDCDDGDVLTYPGADEYCDGADNDCNGLVDDGAAVDAPIWYVDVDGDGVAGTPVVSCAEPSGASTEGPDCNDADPLVSPFAPEVCGGGDEDCDGLTDDADPDVVGQVDYYVDGDGDGFGAGGVVRACVAAPDLVLEATDCDDADAVVSPAGTEVCGGVDEDCDGLTDDADPSVADGTTWYRDGDGDGYGTTSVVAVRCAQPTSTSSVDTDCADSDAGVNPGASEDCRTAADDNCDGETNTPDAVACTAWYADVDGDGWGAGTSQCQCLGTGPYPSATSTDCDDTDPEVHPGATESCDTPADDNCDGDTNDLSAWNCTVRYLDDDRDGFGSALSECRCVADGSYDCFDATDCDDSAAAAHPGGAEVYYDGVDEACDGGSDYDQDGDGYDSTAYGGVDCDDLDPTRSPAATEVCNDGVDNNCDGSAGGCVRAGTLLAVADSDAVVYADEGADVDFGRALAVGPVDTSGGADLVVGAPGWDANDGAVYQFLAAPLGVNPSSVHDYRLYNLGGDAFGSSVAVLLDGTAQQVYVGEPGNDDMYTDAGAAWRFDGPAGGQATSAACTELYGADSTAASGSAVGVMSDTDADGGPELVVGSSDQSWSRQYAGMVTLVSMTACGAEQLTLDRGWYGRYSHGHLGAVVGVGDVTGDGVEDVVASAPGESGWASSAGGVYILELASGGYARADSAATAEWQGIGYWDQAGTALAVVGDLTGDGLDDVIVGASAVDAGVGSEGQVYVVPGGSTGVQSLSSAAITLTGETPYLHFGSSVAALDLDGDGVLDLAVGASGDSSRGGSWGTDSGHAFLFQGPLGASLGSSSADVVVEGDSGDSLGASMAIGDLDADGFDDWVIGAPTDSYWYSSRAGAIYVLYGSGL